MYDSGADCSASGGSEMEANSICCNPYCGQARQPCRSSAGQLENLGRAILALVWIGANDCRNAIRWWLLPWNWPDISDAVHNVILDGSLSRHYLRPSGSK